MKKIITLMLMLFSIGIFAVEPIEIIVPRSPGGANDIFARRAAESLTDILKQEVIVVNKPGADGLIAFKYAQERPNNRIVMYSSGAVASEVLNPNIGYSYTNVNIVAPILTGSAVFFVGKKSNINTFAEFVERARKQNINCASASPSFTLIQNHLYNTLKLKNVRVILYKGTAEAALAVASGDVDCMLDTTDVIIELVKSKKLKVLAAPHLAKEWPNAITFNQINNFNYPGIYWLGLGVLQSADPNIRDYLLDGIRQLSSDSKFKFSMSRGYDISIVKPKDQKFINDNFKFYQDAAIQ